MRPTTQPKFGIGDGHLAPAKREATAETVYVACEKCGRLIPDRCPACGWCGRKRATP